MTVSSSKFHFLDTNVLLKHANNDSGDASEDIERILTEAAYGQRKLWVSSVLYAEFRPSAFIPSGRFPNLDRFVAYVSGVTTTVSPTPETMLRAARLRDLKWIRPPEIRAEKERSRFMTLGDSIHLATALWVKEALDIGDELEFLTFDDGNSKTGEAEDGKRALSMLRLQDYTYDIADNPDVMAVVALKRIKPLLVNPTLANLGVPSPIPAPAATGVVAPTPSSVSQSPSGAPLNTPKE